MHNEMKYMQSFADFKELNACEQSHYLQCLVVSLEFSAETLQLAAGQDGFAVFSLQVDLLLDNLRLLLLQGFQLFLHAAALLQLNQPQSHKHMKIKGK